MPIAFAAAEPLGQDRRISRQPMTVPTASTIEPRDAIRAASAPMIPSRCAICVIAVGTKIDPAHCPMIDTVYTSDMTVVRVLYLGENSVPNASFIVFRFFCSPNCSCQSLDSLTPHRMNAMKSAGTTAEEEHPAPSVVGADEIVGHRGQEEPEVVAGVQDAGGHLPAILGQFFGHERRADRLFTAEPDAAQHAKDHQLPDVGDQPAHEREERIGEDGQHQRAHAADAITDRPPHHRQAPPEQKHREENAAPEADVHGRGGNARSRQESPSAQARARARR